MGTFNACFILMLRANLLGIAYFKLMPIFTDARGIYVNEWRKEKIKIFFYFLFFSLYNFILISYDIKLIVL